ncbi:MAG: TolB family protein, partial [Spirochaetota bacterium]
IDVDQQQHDYQIMFTKVREVYLDNTFSSGNLEDFFGSSLQESFNYEFSWFPSSSLFVFTSNGGLGEYNIFIGSVKENDPELLNLIDFLHPKKFNKYFMLTEEIKKDGQAKVSPDGTQLVYTSGRTGNGDLYLLDLVTGNHRRLTYSDNTDFYPRWSPDSKEIVYTSGNEHSHDIHVIRDVGGADEHDQVLVSWFFDDVLPKYSPDGKKISFYTTYNLEGDPFNTRRWGLMIIPSDGSAPKKGEELIDYFHIPNVIKDNYQATAWFPDSRHIIYAKNIDSDYNPIYIYNTRTREERYINTRTSINHDVTVSTHGLVSFRAQYLGWDRIYIANTTYFQEYLRKKYGN